MIKNKQLAGTYSKVKSIDIHFHKKSVRVRTAVCDKDGNESGVTQEREFNLKTFVESSRSEAEGQVDFNELRAEAEDLIAGAEKNRPDNKKLTQKQRQEIIDSVKFKAISDKARQLATKKESLMLKQVINLIEWGESLLLDN